MNNIVEKITEAIESALSDVEWSEIPLSMKIEDILTQYVILHKGENRHPYADVLHEWVEGKSIQEENGEGWKNTVKATVLFNDEQYRIKQP